MSKKILKGSEFLIAETPCSDVFTPEDFSDEQRAIAETTEQFVENEILPNAEEIDQQNFELVVSGMKQCGELGLLMIDVRSFSRKCSFHFVLNSLNPSQPTFLQKRSTVGGETGTASASSRMRM